MAHPDYNDGKLIIVDAYDDHESALAGHERWLAAMTTEPLPDVLTDCHNSLLSQLLPDNESFPRNR